ncbi:hypothetical protein [Streptomyces chromofuscus]|uniref:Gram-positive cocci surface proteins LPxTG domain-containing protein n=1 Tax=Streptomyces chromofuscus TaxID=42881 RepID=A0A7M2TEC8_STRCW|nr:hypothetical protein [Streptomyces chromofuscus]QOV46862.1 hypothetical protein IPT68_13840 [Streptomyces chromofuscus]GGT14096.1 hypothetical protein GCM10010254_38350 [Streptomyces chromofuscus]
MRLCTPVTLSLAAAALLGGAASPVHAAPGSDCTASDNRQFPITTRIPGGPGSYDAGGGYGTWTIELTNTTQSLCTDIHPVVVLVDGKRALKPSQPRMEFYEGARPRPVRFERTDQDELVGAFGDGFAGFTVPPGQTLTVRVRLAMTSDAVPNDVTANAAVVQRRDDDGDWVGQSNDYRFRVRAEPKGAAEPDGDPSATSTAAAPDGHLSFADELARTGLTTPRGALAAASFLLVVAGGVLLLARRRR